MFDSVDGMDGGAILGDGQHLDSLNTDAEALTYKVEKARVAQLLTLRSVAEDSSWGRDGAAAMTPWLQQRCGLIHADALALTKLVNLLRRLPGLAEALELGITTIAHLEALSAVATDRRSEAVEFYRRQLVADATALSAVEYEKLCARFAELADEHLAEPAGSDGYGLTLRPTLFGEADITGHLTADQYATVGEALNTMNGPDPAAAPVKRTVKQRNADALTDICHQHLNGNTASKDEDSGGKATVRRAKPTALISIDIDTALDTHLDLARMHGFADTGDQIDMTKIRAELLAGGPLPKFVTDLLTCDASLRRLVVDTAGIPLNIGRSTPTVTEAQRIALHVRDKGCVFPHCTRPAQWCDAHHVQPRSRGGPTDLHNLVLLCRHHHRLIHGPDWDLSFDPATSTVTATRTDGLGYSRQLGHHANDPPQRE